MKNNDLKTPPTDWAKVDALTDEEIDLSDSPELDDDFFENATWVFPNGALMVKLSPDAMQKIRALAQERQVSETAIAVEWLEEKAALAA